MYLGHNFVFPPLRRYFTYRSTNDQYFMLDFCYWVNGALILQELLCDCSQPDGFCSAWFKVSYVIVAGPISSAVVIWANSLVFHSIDKVKRKKVSNFVAEGPWL